MQLKSILEGALLAAGKPLTLEQLGALFEENSRPEPAELREALEELRWRIQQVVNREVRLRKTPQIEFRPDDVLASALRVEEILRQLDDDES